MTTRLDDRPTLAPAAAAPVHAAPTGSTGGNRRLLHYLGQSLLIQLRDWAFLGFVIVMPTTVYLFFAGIFGSQPSESGPSVAALMMVTMATYGGLGAAMNAGSQIQSERSSGWFRQLMLTALAPGQFVLAKIATAIAVLIPAIGAVFLAGVALGVRLEAAVWAASFALIIAALLPMIVLGLVIGLWFKLDLMPAGMQAIGRLLPSYWASQIGGWPLAGGEFPWQGVIVLAVWLATLAALGGLGYRRAIRTSRR